MKPSLRSLRQLARMAWDRSFCRPHPQLEKFGGESEWHIRRDLLRNGALVISGGVGNDISFELSLATCFGAEVHLYDPTPTGRTTMGKIFDLPSAVKFYPVGLAGSDGPVSFCPPADEAEGSWTEQGRHSAEVSGRKTIFPCRSIGSLCREARRSPVLVKLDIEGSEYEVIREMIRSGVRPDMLAVEFHYSRSGRSRIDALRCLLSLFFAGYRLQHKRMTDYLFVRKSAPGKPASTES